ncbi:SDR family oxidoreductase [Moheibacter sediminis]|uniref:NAD(P)-dependent dehydrogenase, short-chain alcohol dehydrogenase family n=1 Tax=Moheibacter sediminis TaxID=1434700 RepID=A0A1W2BNA9_9FLAO|nr:SDR family oxidoreductase [Moheibacter sediminis]SMC74313.1 NAD(P)-dependent dehydrogenase, short-chain alcohol dehydrogenase family [Moheibacter sediminis]
MKSKTKKIPSQTQRQQPGKESRMKPQPEFSPINDRKEGRLEGKVTIITGGDSGIGRAVAVAFAEEGADIVIAYLDEHEDAKKTAEEIKNKGRKVLLIAGDVSKESFCKKVIQKTIDKFEKIDILINNAAVQYETDSPTDITKEQLLKTFGVNVFSAFYLSIAAIPHMKKGASIINSTSVTAYRGSDHLIDYSTTKGALVSFTRSMSAALVDKGIRVNAVAPGPIWTPLIPASFDAKQVAKFGKDTPMKRPGQPNEVAPCYVFLASEDANYMTGQVLHPNGGEIING